MFSSLVESIRIEAVDKDERERRKVARGVAAMGASNVKAAGRRSTGENPDRLARRQQSAEYAREKGRHPASTHVKDKHLFKIADKVRGRGGRGPRLSTGGPS